jgi:hypothetical protein
MHRADIEGQIRRGPRGRRSYATIVRLTCGNINDRFGSLGDQRTHFLICALDAIKDGSIDKAKEWLLLALMDDHEHEFIYELSVERRAEIAGTTSEHIRNRIEQLTA